ncbi:MAG: GNAT family N-acetyltransferase [Ectothiorhodospiraceae bacterium]|nr:GNAT family N-acetyltransferase [Ectothiorhodospiraceae bacterium]
MRAELADGGALVAEHGATVVGCVFWHPRDDGIYLDRLAVLPPWRGHGVGRRLVDAVEALARDAGAHHVSLSVRLALERQRAWYASLGYGFLSEGTHPGYDRPTNVTLRKPLAPST